MAEKTNSIRPEAGGPVKLDEMDRKLLALLAVDSTRSYAELSGLLHLSAPAIHDRVKRLKRDGVIQATVAKLDGNKLGRPLLAFVHVFSKRLSTSEQLRSLAAFPDIEEIHSVTGESGILIKVRTRDPQALEALLERIHRIGGVEGTRSYIALSTALERGPSAEW